MTRAGAAAQFLIVLLLAASPAGAYWNQNGGDMYGSGLADLPDAPLDVTSSFRLFNDTQTTGAYPLGFADTPHGITGLVYDEALSSVDATNATSGATVQCRLIRVTDPVQGTVRELSRFSCENGGKMLLYDEARDLLVLSVEGPLPDGMLRLVEARDGSEVWRTGPTMTVPTTPGVQDTGDWFIDDAVLDEDMGVLYVPFASETGQHSIEAIDIDERRSIWQTVVPVESAVRHSRAGPNPNPLEGVPPIPGAEARPWSASNTLTLTRTDTGLVAVVLGGAPRAAWMTLDGELVASMGDEPRDYPDGAEASLGYTVNPAARGARAALRWGAEIVYVNPATATVESVDAYDGFTTVQLPDPIWAGDHVLAPDLRGAFIHQPNGGELRYWPTFEGARFETAIGTHAGEAIVLLEAGEGGSARNTLVTIDLDDARTVHTLPLPSALAPAKLLPVREPPGLLVYDRNSGLATFLAPAEAGLVPEVAISGRYPAVDEPVTLEIASSDATDVIVAWGDGAIDHAAPGGSLSRAFAEPGLHVLRATAVHEDGRTGTATVQVFVGQAPPQDLTPLQAAFAPENQDTTWGLIGLFVAVAGGLIALVGRRRRRGILQRELAAIEQAFEDTRAHPPECEAAMVERARHCRSLLIDGALDETQFAVLKQRIDELGRDLRLSMLDERFQFLPHGMVLSLRDMLRDGRISAWEREHVMRAVDEDGVLTEEQKDRVRALVDGWFRGDSGVDP